MSLRLFQPSPPATRGHNHDPRLGKSWSTTWLTPPEIIRALGPFDLDPCAAPEPRPWPTASRHVSLPDDGLACPWDGRVWLNSPYGRETWRWLERLAGHGDGIALIFVRSDVAAFQGLVLGRAHGLLFFQGRIRFCRADGTRASINAPAPSCLVAYGSNNLRALESSGLPGKVVRLAASQEPV